MHKGIFFGIFLIMGVSLHSCSWLTGKAYGFRRLKPLSHEEVSSIGSDLNIPKGYSGFADSTSIKKIRDLVNRYPAPLKKGFLQPLQILGFSNSDTLFAHSVNCYAGGFPNLKWNFSLPEQGEKAQFNMPEIAPVSVIDYLNCFKDITEPLIQNLSTTDTLIVVQWNNWMFRQSKILIDHAQRISKNSENTKVLYINNDLLFVSYFD